MKEIFVFGAGASKASAETPLGEDLVWRYHLDCSNPYPIKNGEYDTHEDDIEFVNYKKFLELAGSVYPELRKEKLKFQKRNGCYYEPPPFVFEDKKYYVDEILRILQQKGNIRGTELIRKLIFEHIIGTGIESENELYKKFVNKVLPQKSPESVSLMSFNFDVFLWEDYGFEVSFDYLIDFDWIDKNRIKSYNQRSFFPMIKLNGSFDWDICRMCKKIHLYFPPTHRYFYDQKHCCINNCGGIVEPLIIIPHEEYIKRIKTLWEKAKEELKQAERITIIGYSFPYYDRDVIDIFKNSMNNNVEIVVVNYCEPDEHKTRFYDIKNSYRSMFPNLKKEIRIYLKGFKEYMKDLISSNNTI